MRLKITLSLILSLLLTLNVSAQDVSQCDAALLPTVENNTSDYSMIYAYMSENADMEYDKLEKMSKEKREAEASYKVFSAEYNDSKNASDFQERVSQRLTKEGVSMKQDEAKAYYRRHLTSRQLEEWSNCVKQVTSGGSVIITANKTAPKSFPIVVSWRPQRGIGSGFLGLEVRGAKINNNESIQLLLKGERDMSFVVDPDINSRSIVIAANIEGATDNVVLPREFKKIAPPRETNTGLRRVMKSLDTFPKVYSQNDQDPTYGNCYGHKWAMTGAGDQTVSCTVLEVNGSTTKPNEYIRIDKQSLPTDPSQIWWYIHINSCAGPISVKVDCQRVTLEP